LRLDINDTFSLSGHGRWINSGFFFPTFVVPGDSGFTLTDPNSANINNLPSRTYFDLLGTVTILDQNVDNLEVYVGVDNVFNQDPARFPGANGAGNNVLFNPVGRMFKAGLRAEF
jgi:iron complex outermembrane receptor protein